MDEFLSALIKFLADANIVPEEVTPTDTNREKTYIVDLPATPDNVVVFRNYRTRHASLIAKEVGVKYIQVLVRNKSQKMAYDIIQGLYKFLLNRPEEIEYITSTLWVMFDVQQGPVKLQIDDQGRHLWSLSFPVTTQII